MSTEQIKSTSTATFAASPQMNAISIFVAIVLGSSIIEFNELLFPPKITSIAFWGILPVYYFALSAWFGIIAWGRYTPYLDKPTSRTWITFLLIGWASLLALMYFASRLPDSLLSYLWGLVVLFILLHFIQFLRRRDTGLPEPTGLCVLFSVFATVIAVTYSICLFAFPPVSNVANWVFVSAALVVMIGYRVALRWKHVWRPEEKQ